MKAWPLLLAWLVATPCAAQVTLTLESDHALTPNETDSMGVFCRWFHHPARNRFYAVYAGRPANSPLQPGRMPWFSWREYDPGFQFTGRRGTLPGFPGAGDFGMVQVDSTYFHLTTTGTDYKLSRFDDDFALTGSTVIPLDPNDSNTDQMMGWGNGSLLIGSLHEDTATHPRFPMQPAWTPRVHLFPYSTALTPTEPDRHLDPTLYSWGASATWNPRNQRYVIVTMDSFPAYDLYAYEYDANWNFLSQHLLSGDGQWSQGLLWDGEHYFVAYHMGNEHRCGNVVVAAFDIDWNPLASITLNDFHSYPPPLGPGFVAQRPCLTRVGDSLYVSYDVDPYDFLGGTAVIGRKAWQAHVSVVRIGFLTGAPSVAAALPLHVYPVPSRGGFRYSRGAATADVADLVVTDVRGRVVLRTRARADGAFDLSKQPAGVYFVRVRDGRGESTCRVIKID